MDSKISRSFKYSATALNESKTLYLLLLNSYLLLKLGDFFTNPD